MKKKKVTHETRPLTAGPSSISPLFRGFDGEVRKPIDFKPSQVVLEDIPLVGTMGSPEIEQAAAMIVRACQVREDEWKSVPLDKLLEVIEEDAKKGQRPFAKLMKSRFFRPAPWEGVDRGFIAAASRPTGFSFTAKGLEALRKWVQPARLSSTARSE